MLKFLLHLFLRIFNFNPGILSDVIYSLVTFAISAKFTIISKLSPTFTSSPCFFFIFTDDTIGAELSIIIGFIIPFSFTTTASFLFPAKSIRLSTFQIDEMAV